MGRRLIEARRKVVALDSGRQAIWRPPSNSGSQKSVKNVEETIPGAAGNGR
jgi:hypothetical protein